MFYAYVNLILYAFQNVLNCKTFFSNPSLPHPHPPHPRSWVAALEIFVNLTSLLFLGLPHE